jgi:uncharacterized protein YdgA (DUF945 family)
VKKSFVALLLGLALIILISPGIVGRLAEKSMSESLDWAATESQDVVVTSQGFERGWFSSEGQHRVEIKDGELRDVFLAYTGSDDVPALIIDTRMDHGLIPVSSMSRDKGSLLPGLGRAISTLSIETTRGEVIPVPGTIFSTVGLTGELQSNYVLEPGSFTDDGTTASWDGVDVVVTTSPSSGDIGFSGVIESFAVDSMTDSLHIGAIEFSGKQQPSPFGLWVGTVDASVDTFEFSDDVPTTIGPIELRTSSSVDGDRINASASLRIERAPVEEFGDADIGFNLRIEDADGRALGRIKQRVDRIGLQDDSQAVLMQLETEAQRLVAAGLKLHVDHLNVAWPGGTIASELHIVIDESDVDSFSWPAALISVDASADISVPQDLVDIITAQNPEANAAIGMGFLRKNGDVYEMHAEFKQGLLTVNGAPIPFPLPGM